MEVTAKIESITNSEDNVVVKVGYYTTDTDMLLGDKTYYLDPGQTIEDLKPRIKDHTASFDDARKKAETLKAEVGTAVDLTDVVSEKEQAVIDEEKKLAEAKAAEKAMADAKAAEAEKVALDNKE